MDDTTDEDEDLIQHSPLELMETDDFSIDPSVLAARVIQTVYRYAKDRRQYCVVKNAALLIQRSFRRFNAQKVKIIQFSFIIIKELIFFYYFD